MGCTTEYIKQMMIDPVCGRTFALLRKAEDDWEKCGYVDAQRADDIKKTSYQRRCDVMMTHRRRSDVFLTSSACWVYVC